MHPLTSQSRTRPSLRLRLKRLALPLAVAAVTAAATNALASTLTVIPLKYNGTYGEWQNEGRAITPDGAFVVGVEYKSNTVYQAYMDGIFYNVTNNTVVVPRESDMPPRILTGVGYRTDGGQKQTIMDGYDQSNFVQSDWMTTDGGATWGAKRRNTSFSAGKDLPVANSLGAVTGSSTFYTVIGDSTDVNNERNLYICQGSNTWSSSMPFIQKDNNIGNPDAGHFTGVAATGRAVGWYRVYINSTNGVRYNYVVNWPPPTAGYTTNTWYFHGLNANTNEGEAWSVSSDGTKIFGRSPVTTDTNWHGYKAVVTAGTPTLQSIQMLPEFSNTGGAQNLACPYGCSADGRYAVGMNYRGIERAVIWDTGDANPANWTVVDLMDVASAEGLLGVAPNPRWSALTRAYSVGTNAVGDPVVTGYGYYYDGTNWYNRAFVMTVSQCSFVANAAAIATPVYDTATTVIVTNCNPAATTVKVYHVGSPYPTYSLIGSAPGGAATVVVTVAPPALVAGWVLKVTQTVGGQESCLTTAPSVIVTTPANPPPVVVLTTPTNNASFMAPATIALSATVTSNFNTINYIAFYNWGTNLIASINTPPYTYSWANVLAGTYSLSARVGYNSSPTVDSAASLVTVSMPLLTSTLTAIPLPPWTSGEYRSQGRAISPDGKYLVGPCYYSNPGDGDGFFYDVDNGIVIQPSASSHTDQQYPPNTLTGIAYRTDPIHGQQLILDGMSGGYQANWSTTDGGVTWGAMRADTSLTAGFALPVANSLGAVTGSDKFYTIIGNNAGDPNNQRECYTCKGSNTWSSSTPCAFMYSSFVISDPDAGNMCGVAATGQAAGRAVGWYRDNYTYRPTEVKYNCVVDYPPPGGSGSELNRYSKTWYFRGLANTNMGSAWSVSSDGTKIFGHSPTPTDSNWHGYKAIVTSAQNSLQGIPQQLPDFPDTAGSVNLAVPYGCSADGRYAVGMNYRGLEKATLWDTADANPANWTVLDLTERASAEGILGNFTVLYRAFSIGTNWAGNPVITGVGMYDEGTGLYNRAFVMVVATPRPRITSITGAGTSTVTVNYANTVAGKAYTVQYNTNLSTASWYNVGTKSAPGTSDSQTDSPATTARRYYRVYYTP